MITILNEIYDMNKPSIGMSKTMIRAAVTLVLFTVMLTIGALAYPYGIANAKKLISATHISTSHTTNCDGDVCQMLVCINNKCHGSNPGQGSNSTTP
jgi:hypothetical protein